MDQQLSSSVQTQDSHASSLPGGTINPKRFRSVMGAFATGVAIIDRQLADIGVIATLHAAFLCQR